MAAGYAAGQLAAILKEEKPDLVHCIALRPILVGGFAAAMAGIPRRIYALTGLGFLGRAIRRRSGALSRQRGPAPRPRPADRQTRYLFENAGRSAASGPRPDRSPGHDRRRRRGRSGLLQPGPAAAATAPQGRGGGPHALVEGDRCRGRGGPARPPRREPRSSFPSTARPIRRTPRPFRRDTFADWSRESGRRLAWADCGRRPRSGATTTSAACPRAAAKACPAPSSKAPPADGPS